MQEVSDMYVVSRILTLSFHLYALYLGQNENGDSAYFSVSLHLR